MKCCKTPFGTCGQARREYKAKRPRAGLLVCSLGLMIAFAPVPQALAGQVEKSVSVAAIVAPKRVHHPREKTFMKRQWGVEVLFVRQTAAGYMLEFRYKVLDADKARPLFERRTKPLLTHAKSGAKLIVPTPAKTGALRNSNPPRDGNTYWMFFANPGKLVQPGDLVDINVGEFRAGGLVVQ